MLTIPEADVLKWDGLIIDLARKRCRQQGAEFDDLQQEGRTEVLTKYLTGVEPTERDVINAMRRYMRSVREGRMIEYEPDISSLLTLSS